MTTQSKEGARTRLVIDYKAGRILANGNEVRLTGQQRLFLSLLLLNAGKPCSKGWLTEQIWTRRYKDPPKEKITDTLACLINKALREATGSGIYVIQSVARRGYLIPDTAIGDIGELIQDQEQEGRNAEAFKVNGMDIVYRNCTIWLGNVPLRLAYQEEELFLLLLRKQGHVLEKIDLLKHLHPEKNDIEMQELKLVDVLICKIRRTLSKAGAEVALIGTVWGQGYFAFPPEGPVSKEHPGDLPPLDGRWVPSRKLEVVKLVLAGKRTPEEIARYYPGVAPEQIERWTKIFMNYGLPGLRSTRAQFYANAV